MLTETEGIVLREVKALNGRKMITVFTKKYGKIPLGVSDTSSSKKKPNLAVKPFSYAKYEVYKNRENFNLSSAQVINSNYAIGENLDNFMAASYVLELTDKAFPENVPQPKAFNLLLSFLEGITKREKDVGTLVIAYIVKLLDITGTSPVTDACAACGKALDIGDIKEKNPNASLLFSIKDGGVICSSCASQKLIDGLTAKSMEESLIYKVEIGIIDVLNYFKKSQFSAFEKLVLEEKTEERLKALLKEYMSFHLDINNLKSESFF